VNPMHSGWSAQYSAESRNDPTAISGTDAMMLWS
jgi:hypothetical protein